MKARTAVLIALCVFAALAVAATAAGPPGPPKQIMQRMIKAANGDPKKLEAMKQRMQQEMKKRGGAKAGAPRRAAAAAAGGAPKLPKPVLDRIRKESGGDPKKAKAMASKAAQEMQKRSGGGARKGAAAGMPAKVKDAMMAQRREVEKLQKERRNLQVMISEAHGRPHTALDGVIDPSSVTPKFTSLSTRLTAAVMSQEFAVANEILATMDQMVSDIKLQVGRLERGDLDMSKRDPSKLTIDEGVNYDTGAPYSKNIIHGADVECAGATTGAKLLVQYVGKLAATEHTFVSSLGTKGTMIEIGSDTNLEGVDSALKGSCPGQRIAAVVPAAMAYGEDGLEDGSGKLIVPPGATLEFYFDILRSTGGTEL